MRSRPEEAFQRKGQSEVAGAAEERRADEVGILRMKRMGFVGAGVFEISGAGISPDPEPDPELCYQTCVRWYARFRSGPVPCASQGAVFPAASRAPDPAGACRTACALCPGRCAALPSIRSSTGPEEPG